MDPEKSKRPDWKFIVGLALALIGLGLDQADVHLQVVAWLCFLGCAALLVSALQQTGWGQRQDRRRYLVSVDACIVLVFVAAGYFIPKLKTEKPNAVVVADKPKQSQSVPSLAASIILDTLPHGKTNLRLSVENLSDESLTKVRAYCRAEGNSFAYLEGNTDLSGRGRTEFPAFDLLSNKRPINIACAVTYNYILDDIETSRYATYNFLIYAPSPIQPANPISQQEGFGPPVLDQASQMYTQKFADPVGTIYLLLKESNLQPDEDFILSARGRLVVVDPKTRIVTIARSSKKSIKKVVQPLAATAQHVIAIEWNDSTQAIGLSVDQLPLKVK